MLELIARRLQDGGNRTGAVQDSIMREFAEAPPQRERGPAKR
ncbi:hypothetical protein [Nocardia cyriacigeorgica]|nr:hypothetical protein [Nocardia cyriacigeorgica]